MNEKIKAMLQKGTPEGAITAVLGCTPGAVGRVRLELAKSSGLAAKAYDNPVKSLLRKSTHELRALAKTFFDQDGAENYIPRFIKRLKDLGYDENGILAIMPRVDRDAVQKALASGY